MEKTALAKLKNEYIGILGLGLENQSFLRLLARQNLATQLCLCDQREAKEIKQVLSQAEIPSSFIKSLEIQSEKLYSNNLERFDRLMRSPGWPLWDKKLASAEEKGVTIDSPMNLFLRLCPTKNIVAVTGSKGKGTTASLVAKILEKAGKKAFLGGNIGIAPLDFLDKISANSWVVLELSSFQLEDLAIKPRIGIITNLFKEHLAPADPNNPNYHRNLRTYWQAKLNIARQQSSRQTLIANTKLRGRLEKAGLRSKVIYFSRSQSPSRLTGNFNQENIAAAEAAAQELKISSKKYAAAIADFGNLEHRLEKVIDRGGISYYDNSFATTPESTRLDLLSFSRPIIAIMGGADKGADFSALAKAITRKVKAVIMLPGQGSARLEKSLQKEGYKHTTKAKSMQEAVAAANKQAISGDIILLSTACASFGIFKNYKDRGDQFKKYVRKNI